MKTATTIPESAMSKRGFGVKLLFYAFLLSIIGLSKAFAQVPNAPMATAADNFTCTSFNANWDSVFTATDYYLDVSTDIAFTSFVSGFSDSIVGNVTTFNLTGVLSTQTYYYRVRAENGNGTSINSNTITVNIDPVATATPSSQTICSGDTTSIAFSSSTTGTTYSWTVSQSGVTGASSGTGSSIAQTLTLTGPNSGYVSYIITPNNGCNGSNVWVNITVMSCQGGTGMSFVSPQNGATINNRCELQFCVYDSTGIGFAEIFDTAYNYIGSVQSGQDTFCIPISVYLNTIAPGSNTFYLAANGIFYDTVTVNITAPITALQNQLTLTQTPQPNGVYDFTVSGFSSSETYTMILQNNYNNQSNDTLLVSNTTIATISHQYPYNGDFNYSIIIIADCDNSIFYSDSTHVTVNSTSCSSYIAFQYSSMSVGNCASDVANFYSYVGFDNLFGNDSSQLVINWGDGSTESIQIQHNGNTSGSWQNVNGSHQYSAPGVYTVFLKLIDANACYMDSIIQSVTIGSTTCGSLTGTIYGDGNNNCTQDIGEAGIANVPVIVTMGSNTYWAWTDYQGNYAFNYLPAGTYSIQIAYLNSGYTITCSNSSVTITAGTATSNFGVSCGGAFDVAITHISLMNGFFPGVADAILPHIGLLNGGCTTTAVSGQVIVVLDACIDYSTSGWGFGNTPDVVIPTVTGDSLIWNVSDINNIGTFSYWDYAVNTMTCTSAQAGDTACITVMVLPTNGDADLSNNSITQCFAIGVSYDPNNKEVLPAGTGAQGFIPADEPSLTYTINFQNTGTAPAHNIYVLDTLDTDLDINSIEILNASHRMQVYTLPNRVIKFMFDNIMLPDSTQDEMNSHGYVTFKIKLNNGLTPGTEMENTGYIYFDYNEPIVTNTELNTIEIPSGIREIKNDIGLRVYPNPAKDKLMVYTNRNSAGSAIAITDVLGKTIKTLKTSELSTEINVTDLQSGVYFIKVTQGNNSNTQKIIISK